MARDDEIVREVRRIRARLVREAGGTVDGVFKQIKRWEAEDERSRFVDRATTLGSKRRKKAKSVSTRRKARGKR